MTSAIQLSLFAISATVIMSFIYFILLEKIKGDKNAKTRARLISLYIWRKVGGFILLGFVPAVLAFIFFQAGPEAAGLVMGKTMESWPWIIGATIFFIMLNAFNSKDDALRSVYPELKLKEWNVTGLAISIAGWVLYLAAYEYLFRGLLLMSCYSAFGYWPAIVINLALYSTLHLPKGMKEAIAAIPFGALICYLTIESGSILPTIFLHSVQAVTIELFCIYRNPEMNFRLLKNKKP